MDDSIDELDDIAIGEVEEEEQPASFSEESPPSQVPVNSDRVDEKTDPVSLYLRDIGSTPLLTREREVQLGMQMEQGQEEYIDSVIASPFAVRQVLDLAEKIKSNETPLDRVLMAGDDREAFDETAERRRFLKGVTVVTRAGQGSAAHTGGARPQKDLPETPGHAGSRSGQEAGASHRRGEGTTPLEGLDRRCRGKSQGVAPRPRQVAGTGPQSHARQRGQTDGRRDRGH